MQWNIAKKGEKNLSFKAALRYRPLVYSVQYRWRIVSAVCSFKVQRVCFLYQETASSTLSVKNAIPMSSAAFWFKLKRLLFGSYIALQNGYNSRLEQTDFPAHCNTAKSLSRLVKCVEE